MEKPRKERKEGPDRPMLSPETLEKVKHFFDNRSKIDEIIQDGNTLYSLRFVKGEQGKIVA